MNIFDTIREEYIDNWVSVRNHKGERIIVKVIKVDIACNKNHGRVRLTVDNSDEDCDRWYDLYMPGYHSQKRNLFPAFDSIVEYNRYYGISDGVRFMEVKK